MSTTTWGFMGHNTTSSYAGKITTTSSTHSPPRESVVVDDLVVGKSYMFASVDGSVSLVAEVVETFVLEGMGGMEGEVFVEVDSEIWTYPKVVRLSNYVYEAMEEL